jgi:hypothetical protein
LDYLHIFCEFPAFCEVFEVGDEVGVFFYKGAEGGAARKEF